MVMKNNTNENKILFNFFNMQYYYGYENYIYEIKCSYDPLSLITLCTCQNFLNGITFSKNEILY